MVGKNIQCAIFCVVCAITVAPTQVFCQSSGMDGVDLVFKACESFCQRNSAVQSGELELSFTHTTPPKNAEEKAKFIKIVEDYYKQSCGDDVAWYEERTKDMEKVLRERTNFYENVKRSDLKFQFSGDFYSDYKRKAEIIPWAETPNKPSEKPRIALFSRTANRDFSTVDFEPGMKSVVLLPASSVAENILQLGQIRGEVASIIISSIYRTSSKQISGESEKALAEIKQIVAKSFADISVVILKVVGETNYDSTCRAIVVESESKKRTTHRYWIDPARGFLCPLVQRYDSETGILIKEYRSENYFLHKQTGLWFPGRFEESTFEKKNGELVEKMEYLLKADTLKLNNPQGDSVFSVDVPEGFNVADARTANTKNYLAVEKGTLSFTQGGLDVDGMDWLRPIEHSDGEYVPATNLRLYVRFILIVPGILLFSIWCFLQMKKNGR